MAKERLFSLTEGEFWKLAGQRASMDGNRALERFQRIKDAGGDPVAFYSSNDGLRVLDDSDEEQSSIVTSLQRRAKRWHG